MTKSLRSHQATASARDQGRFWWTGILDWIETHCAQFLLVVFLVVAAALILSFAARGKLGAPPGRGDGPDYENIAFNLAHGHGFRFDWDNPEWRALYEQHNSDHQYDYVLSRRGSRTTAYYPPILPLLIAGNHLLSGRQFVTVRISNVILIAAAICLAATLAMRLIGPLGTVLVPLLAVADRRMLAYSGTILTESLGLFAVVLLTWRLARLHDRPSTRNVGLAGAALGFAVLCRSIFVLWYPLLAVVVFLLVRHAQARRNGHRALAAAAVFLAAAVAVPSPWWVRNCFVLEAAMPLGTQGGIALPGGYSDAAWRSGGGNWVSPRLWELYDPLIRSDEYGALPGRLQERERARLGARYVGEWIKGNPEKLPVLAWRRLKDHLRPHNAYEAVLLALACGGLLVAWRQPLARLLAGSVGINALAVMATYAAGGRFLIPVKGSVYVLAAVGLVALGRWLAAQIARRQARA